MMTDRTNPAAETPVKEVVFRRTFDAPRELVFEAWTDPAHVVHWWGPKHFTNALCEVDARPGGSLLVHMQAPDGQIYPAKGTFEEVVAPERIVLLSSAVEDEAGEPQLVARHIITFEEADGKTHLTMQAIVLKATEMAQGALSGMEQGWDETFDKLEDYVSSLSS